MALKIGAKVKLLNEAGGGYVWARAGLGDTQGFFSGWMSWFAAAVAGSLYSLGFGAYFVTLLSTIGFQFPQNQIFLIEKIIAVIAIILFLFIILWICLLSTPAVLAALETFPSCSFNNRITYCFSNFSII